MTVVKLESPDYVHWKGFEACRSLRTIQITSNRQRGCFDCCACSFPSTLQHVYLSVENILEDGAFQACHLQQLSTLHLSFKTANGSLDLGAFASGSRKVSIKAMNGMFDLWMPHRDDVAWRQLDSGS